MKLEKDLYTIQEVADLFEVTRRRITRAAIEAFLKAGSDAGAAEEYNSSHMRTPMPALV
jgi:hypothetical protein